MNKQRPRKSNFSVDALTLNVARSIIQDFQTVLNDPTCYRNHLEMLVDGDISGIRSTIPTVDFMTDNPYRLKMDYQVASTLKRYRLRKDLYTDKQLEDEAIAKFLDVQTRLAQYETRDVSTELHHVLDAASVYIRLVLGEYDRDEHGTSCRFGKRASAGIPSKEACEAARWELPITGSSDQITWFDTEMCEYVPVQRYLAEQKGRDPNRSTYRVVDSLKLTLVPKTYKSYRVIMPNTTIGSYISYGLGTMLRKRLRKKGYDISVLQQEHKSLASRGSVHGMYTTLDLSSASDTISTSLVQRLLPPDWFEALNQCRIGQVELPDGQIIESNTFCTMGIGYTFPLQTLIFLSLLKAIWAIDNGKCRATISVYGDDMIFPSSMYKRVVAIFGEIGFMVNIDKTYHEGNFRESCGGDYCHGWDVRPFQPQNGQANVSSIAYEAVLYKYTNTLLARWSEYEVAGTLKYLLSEIRRVAGKAKLVPGDYPDDSGIKSPSLRHWSFLDYDRDVARPKSLGHGSYRFPYLRFVADVREEVRHEPYLWLALGVRSSVNFDALRHYTPWDPEVHPCPLESLKDLRINHHQIKNLAASGDAPTVLIWRESKTKSVRSKISHRRLRRLHAFTTISGFGKYKRQSGISSFENRS